LAFIAVPFGQVIESADRRISFSPGKA